MFNILKDETTLLRRRKHWFILLGELLGIIILAISPFVLYPFIAGQEILIGSYSITIQLSNAWITFLGSAWLLIFWMRSMNIWTNYYLDLWIITDKRIIDIDQKSFFHRRISVLLIEKIQDITIETNGFIPTFLNFGDIHVQTAGEELEFVMNGIANPKHVRKILTKAQYSRQKIHNGESL